jgi:predicted component of type VI protein secretion system
VDKEVNDSAKIAKKGKIMITSHKYYLPDGKIYNGPVHKMGGKSMTGAKHTSSSKIVKITKPKGK